MALRFPLATTINFFAAAASFSFAADFYVSTSGDDGNSGSLAEPWRTIQMAADSVPAGSRVFVREGVYEERVVVNVSGTEGARIEILNFPNEASVIDGTSFTPSGIDEDALITIRDQSYVTVSGFELRNYRTDIRYRVPIGILIAGNSDHVSILGNEIHDIETNYTGLDGGDAHGIAVFGDESDPLDGVEIAGNELYDLRLGSSEALVLNGNVTGFSVTGNTVRDCNNIGIDFIGFEGNGPEPSVDQARDGVCSENTVFNIDASHNPAYGGDFDTGGGDQSAGGIYVDGGTRIVVERNVVHHCNIGIELASEHSGRSTSEITLRNNLVYENDIGGIFMGGYDTARGSTVDCRVTNNTLFRNDTNQDGNGELYLQFDVRDCLVENNIFVANGQGLLIGNPFSQNSGNTVNFNVYFVDEGGTTDWQWKDQYYDSFVAYQGASGNDGDSVYGDPAFLDTESMNWNLSAGSPAIDSGNPAFVADGGEVDLAGNVRVVGGRIDAGSFENQFTRTSPPASGERASLLKSIKKLKKKIKAAKKKGKVAKLRRLKKKRKLLTERLKRLG